MQQEQRVEFEGAEGNRLIGRLHVPLTAPRACALFAHCFTCSKDLRGAYRVSEALAKRGIATLRFDFTGIGESEGDFADTNFSSNVEDLVSAAGWLRKNYSPPGILVGHSLGGAAVIAAAGHIEETRAVATIGAPFHPEHVADLVRSERERIEQEGRAEVEIAGRRFLIKRQFLEDLESQSQTDAIRALRRALLVMHSPQDEVVAIDNARRIYEDALHPKSFVSLDGADHLLSRPRDAEYAATVLSAWASRYVDDQGEQPTTTDGDWVMVNNRAGTLASHIRAGSHTWLADEPANVGGGTDAGPSPYDLLLAALGSCTAMTLRMYARRKDLALEAVQVRLRHDRIHAKDCEDCETTEGKIDRVERQIALTGEVNQAERDRLMEIADMCPVHRTLTSETKIVSREKSKDER